MEVSRSLPWCSTLRGGFVAVQDAYVAESVEFYIHIGLELIVSSSHFGFLDLRNAFGNRFQASDHMDELGAIMISGPS